jgi:hypothetical protein
MVVTPGEAAICVLKIVIPPGGTAIATPLGGTAIIVTPSAGATICITTLLGDFEFLYNLSV